MRIAKYLILTLFTLVSLLLAKSNQSSSSAGDTSMYDWVAYNLLEDYVDLLEMTAWFARRVKDHIDELVEESFIMLTKQQDMLQPALDLTDKHNRPDCAEGKIMNVTDAVFSQYFNMNINCPMIGQKMAVFFNELHNVTERVAGIHRKHFNMSPGCGPPTLATVDRNCLQNIITQCKKETGLIRDHMLNLEFDIEDFMDGQIEEAFICTLNGMSYVRNVTKQAVQDIHCCLDIEEHYEIRRKYESPMLQAAMGNLIGPYDHIDISKETKDRLTQKPFGQQYQPQPGVPQYHPPPPPHPGMHPQYGQPGIIPPGPHPGMHPQYGHPGPHPGMHPHPAAPPHPGMQHQFVPNPGMPQQFVQHPPQQQGYQRPPPGHMQPKDPRKQEESPPPWRINPKNIPNYAYRDGLIRDGSFEFDPSMFQANQEEYGNIFGEENNGDGFDFNDDELTNQFKRKYHNSL